MSSALHDIPSTASFGSLILPTAATASGTGSALGSLSGDGPEFALVQIGTPSSGATIAVSIEESSDLSTWTAIAGATTGTKSAAATVALPYQRTKTYVRARLVVAGSSPSIPVAVACGQQKKLW